MKIENDELELFEQPEFTPEQEARIADMGSITYQLLKVFTENPDLEFDSDCIRDVIEAICMTMLNHAYTIRWPTAVMRPHVDEETGEIDWKNPEVIIDDRGWITNQLIKALNLATQKEMESTDDNS